jgi:hypothetical protein
MVTAVREMQLTSLRKTIVSGGTMRVLASLPPAFTAFNIIVDMTGKVIMPVDCMLGSKTGADSGSTWVWVLFSIMATPHIHDGTCGEACTEEFDLPIVPLGSSGTFIAVLSSMVETSYLQ